MGQEPALLRVDQLSVEYLSARSEPPIRALDGLSFELAKGEKLGILGESGCGKTSLALSLLRMLPRDGRQISGTISFQSRSLERLSEDHLRQMRGAEMSLIFQEPASALHPLKRVGTQIVDVIRAHRSWSLPRCRREMLERLHEVGLEDSQPLSRAYPHQLSGGQRQRVAIALALACRPSLVIADEPTASLDALLSERVLKLFDQLTRESSISWLFISHDPRILARMVDRILVLYAGRLVEEGPARHVLKRPGHPYTRALLRSLPPIPPPAGAASERPSLPVIPGEPMVAHGMATNCRFAARCPRREDRCEREVPIAVEPRVGQRIWCWFPGAGDA